MSSKRFAGSTPSSVVTLGHELIAVAGQAFERFAEHGGGGVGLGRFVEADAVVVGVANEAGEFLLPERGLHVAVVGSGAKGEARYLQS